MAGDSPTPQGAVYAAHIFGVITVIFTSIWSLYFRGGVGWNVENKGLIFNWHPVLMVSAFVFLYGEAIMMFRIITGEKKVAKIVHLTLNGIALVLAIIGIWAAFKYHNENVPPLPNLYSMHSWFGLFTIIVFAIQWVVGLYVFFTPGASVPVRKQVLPWHTFFGVFIFILAVATCTQGINEKLIFLYSAGVPRYGSEANFANFLGLLLFVPAGLVLYVIVDSKKKGVSEEFPLTEGEYQPIE
eukprot:TRINITY_DN424_c0_g1_i1.p1 TRINITY_DN424_c0_g1~~TRINITY_DN424_c0_g1_i1.p1  ORF type:complete len:265 (+),score=60.96 TRINITY_DN424_c0_g1_i1:71-796(+)